MNKITKMINLILILTLNISCVENKSNELKNDNPEFLTTLKADTLKFTSGISSIFQDSKGNYWFGSLQEGVAVFNGKTFAYLSSKDGLTDNQIHSIQEDNEGVIWFNTQKGVSSFDGTRIKNHTDGDTKNLQNRFQIQSNEPLQGKWMKSDKDLWFEAGN